jgi:HAE1 family hydrophobic/amphiphilic exporter-1
MVAKLREMPDVEYTYTTIGEAGSMYRPVTEGTTYVKLKPHGGGTFSEVLREARNKVEQGPGLTFGLTEAGAFGQKPIQISVRGPEIDELDKVSQRLVGEMRKIPGIADIENSLEKSKPELRVDVDRQRASDLGIPVATIATTLQAGVVGQVATTIQDSAGDNHDVRVRLRADQRRYSEDLLKLSVPTDKDDANGDKILKTLSEVANVVPGTGPSSIRRRDLVREVRISANTDGRPLQEVSNDIDAAGRKFNLPAGYDIVAGGDTEELVRMFSDMFRALFLAVVFIYLILASQFGSFTHPLAIMLSLPLSLFGVAVILFVTHDTLNIMSMIGLIMLMGLVTKNAILLVDFTNQARRTGVPRHKALIQAGTTRLRPIVMTTLAMIFGMLPLAFAIGAGAEMRAPMARAVIGGLITSTLLSLLVVPVVYTFLDDFKPSRAWAWMTRRKPAETGAHGTVPSASPATTRYSAR